MNINHLLKNQRSVVTIVTPSGERYVYDPDMQIMNSRFAYLWSPGSRDVERYVTDVPTPLQIALAFDRDLMGSYKSWAQQNLHAFVASETSTIRKSLADEGSKLLAKAVDKTQKNFCIGRYDPNDYERWLRKKLDSDEFLEDLFGW